MDAVRVDPGQGLAFGLIVIRLGEQPALVYVEELLAAQLNLPPAGTPLCEMVDPQDWPAVCQRLTEQLAAGDEVRLSFRLAPGLGDAAGVQLCGRRSGGELSAALALGPLDFYRNYEQLTQWYDGFRALLETTNQQAYEWDLRAHTLAEAGCQSLLWRELMGADPLLAVDADGIPSSENIYLADVPAYRQLHRSIQAGGAGGSVELRMRTGYGTYRWCRLTLATLYDPDGKPRRAVGLMTDIDEEKREALAQAQRNERDGLTGLLNPDSFRTRAAAALERLAEGELALFAVDIDHCQQISDRLGMLFGEAVLIGAADKLSAAAGKGAVCGRLGATTMVCCRRVAARREAASLGRAFCERLRQSFADGRESLEVTASVGMALAAPGERDLAALLRRADQALAEAKRLGGGRLVAYRRGLHDSANGQTPFFAVEPTAAAGAVTARSFNENMFYLFFDMLYGGEDPEGAVSLVLRMAGQHFHTSRAYIYEADPGDGETMRLTHEWRSEEISSLDDVLGEFSIAGESERDRAARCGILQCDDAAAQELLPRALSRRVQAAGVRAFLQCGIVDKGIYRGCIGFDECVAPRIWTQEEAETLSRIARIVGGYLLRVRSQDRRAHQDPVTGLTSFARFRKQAARLLCAPRDETWQLIGMDIVRFADLEDVFGADTAERLLARIGARIRARLAGGELACRVRRDEFALLLRQKEGLTAVQRLRSFEEDLAPVKEALLGNYDLRLACGIRPLARGECPAFSLAYEEADEARRRAHRGGLGGYVYHSPEIALEASRAAALDREAKNALAAGEFSLAYLPIAALADGRPVGLRAVPRWDSAALGAVAAEEFLPRFELSGFVLALDYALFEMACAALARWQADGPVLPVTVGFSQLHLNQADFPARLAEIAARAGVAHGLLRLELSGSEGLRRNRSAVETLHALRAAGFFVSLGDLGAGDPLFDLRGELPCDGVVVPRALFDEPAREPLLAAVLQVAAALGLAARADGVRTPTEAERLRRAGCLSAQGDLYWPPLPEARAAVLLAGLKAQD